MMSFLRLNRRQRKDEQPAVALPADVLAAIEGAFVFARPGNDETGPRVYVQWPGSPTQAWLYTDATVGATLGRLYPDLNPKQITRAARAVAGIVARHLREPSPYAAPKRSGSYAMNW